MKFIKYLIGRIKCKNHEYETITNVSGDLINNLPMSKDGRFCRSVKRCVHCGKVIFSGDWDEDCLVTNYTIRRCKGCDKC